MRGYVRESDLVTDRLVSFCGREADVVERNQVAKLFIFIGGGRGRGGTREQRNSKAVIRENYEWTVDKDEIEKERERESGVKQLATTRIEDAQKRREEDVG